MRTDGVREQTVCKAEGSGRFAMLEGVDNVHERRA